MVAGRAWAVSASPLARCLSGMVPALLSLERQLVRIVWFLDHPVGEIAVQGMDHSPPVGGELLPLGETEFCEVRVIGEVVQKLDPPPNSHVHCLAQRTRLGCAKRPFANEIESRARPEAGGTAMKLAAGGCAPIPGALLNLGAQTISDQTLTPCAGVRPVFSIVTVAMSLFARLSNRKSPAITERYARSS